MEDLLEALYRGVVAEESWDSALDMLSDALGGSSIFLGTFVPGGPTAMAGHRIDPACADLIGGPLATPEANPLIGPMMTKPPRKAIHTSEMCGDAALVRSQLYEAALRPHGQRYTIGAVIERVGSTVRTVAFTRPASKADYEDRDVEFCDSMMPHLARALHLRAEFGALRLQSASAYASMETMQRGIALVSCDGTLFFANREARRIFALADGVSAPTRKIVIADRRAAARFRMAVQVGAAGACGRAATVPIGVAVPRPSGRDDFTMSLVAAPGAIGSVATGTVIVVTISDPESRTPPPELLLRDLYELTATEAKFASLICEMDMHEAATTLGISMNTAKTHLRSIFQKVGVSRQADLVRRLVRDCGV